jgi:hypothetical protein
MPLFVPIGDRHHCPCHRIWQSQEPLQRATASGRIQVLVGWEARPEGERERRRGERRKERGREGKEGERKEGVNIIIQTNRGILDSLPPPLPCTTHTLSFLIYTKHPNYHPRFPSSS